MAELKPSDDAICMAAATMAAALAKARHDNLIRYDPAEQERVLASYFGWAIDAVRQGCEVGKPEQDSSLEFSGLGD